MADITTQILLVRKHKLALRGVHSSDVLPNLRLSRAHMHFPRYPVRTILNHPHAHVRSQDFASPNRVALNNVYPFVCP
jgi:hypothetical protein